MDCCELQSYLLVVLKERGDEIFSKGRNWSDSPGLPFCAGREVNQRNNRPRLLKNSVWLWVRSLDRKRLQIEHTGAGEEVCDWTSGSGHKVSGFMCSILTSLDSTFLGVRESACQCGRLRFGPWARKIPQAMEQLSPGATTIKPVL